MTESRRKEEEKTREERNEENITSSEEEEWEEKTIAEEGKGKTGRHIVEREASSSENRVRQTKRRQEAASPQSAGKEEERRDKLRRQQEVRMHLKKAREARDKGNDIPSHREQGHVSSDDDSVATQLQSNAAKGSSNDKESRSLLQAKEGIDLPVFRGTLPRQYLYRYDIKLQIPESCDAVAMLVQVAKNFWTQILAVDKSAVLVPWATDHQMDGSLVTSLTKFPNLLSTFRKYFPRTNPNIKGMTLYTSMLMAHNLPYEDIMENIRWWLNEK
jgi:hypothetical protein